MTTTRTCRRGRRSIGLMLLLLAPVAAVCRAETKGLAQQHLCDGQCMSCQKPQQSQIVPCRPQENHCVRAGDPHRIAWYARPSRTKHDSFGYVGGGGTTWRGEHRCPDEGTWGLDYAGVLIKKQTWLKWLHGRPSHQTGGSYTTDGPRLFSH